VHFSTILSDREASWREFIKQYCSWVFSLRRNSTFGGTDISTEKNFFFGHVDYIITMLLACTLR